MDELAFVQLLLLALRCFIGIRKRQIHSVCVARQALIGRRLRSRRQAILQLMARWRSHVDRPANNATGALNSATAMVDDTLPQSEPELSTIGDEDLMSPLRCSSPASSSRSGPSQQTRPAKRKRDSNTELLDYLERADERFLRHSKEMNDALLHKLEADNSAFLSMMGHMVSVMEAQARK